MATTVADDAVITTIDMTPAITDDLLVSTILTNLTGADVTITKGNVAGVAIDDVNSHVTLALSST